MTSSYEPIPGYKANIRKSNNKVLGVVSDRYKVVQNCDAFSFTDTLLGEGVRYETAGSLCDGKRIWLLAKLSEQYTIMDEQGYTFDEKFQFGYYGPKSAFLVSRFIWLSEEEFISISNHMGVFDRQPNDYSVKDAFESFPIAFLLHIADYLATILDEKEP